MGLQVREVICKDAPREIVTDRKEPLRLALRVPFWFVVDAPSCIVKAPVLVPAAIISEVGVVSIVLLLETETDAPPVGRFVSVIVHVPDAFGLSAVGLQPNVEMATGATKLMLTFWDPPLRVAVTFALPSLEMVAVVALKLAEVDLAQTPTDVGTVSAVFVLVKVTVEPPVGAG